MQKTKLGISVGLLGAILYFSGLFAGYFVTAAIVAYVLIREENEWLRKTAVKALVLAFFFPILQKVVGVLPDLIDLANDALNMVKLNFADKFFAFLLKPFSLLYSVVSIAHYVVFILLGVLALSEKSFKVPVIDSLIDKHVG